MTKPPSQTLTGDLGAAASLRPETDEELAFCRRWAHERSLTLCQTWLPLAVGFHLLVAGIISFVTQFANVPRWLFGFHLLAAVTTGVFWWRARESHYSPHYFLGMMVTIIAAYSFYLYQVILRGEEIALPAFALVGVAGTFV